MLLKTKIKQLEKELDYFKKINNYVKGININPYTSKYTSIKILNEPDAEIKFYIGESYFKFEINKSYDEKIISSGEYYIYNYKAYNFKTIYFSSNFKRIKMRDEYRKIIENKAIKIIKKLIKKGYYKFKNIENAPEKIQTLLLFK